MSELGTQATSVAIGSIVLGSRVGGRYEIRGVLGEGGMGAVFRAHDHELDEDVALKVIKPEVADTPDALVRFRLEVKLARRVAHPNVARMYDFGEADGIRYLTMELVDGLSLRMTPALPLPEILRIAGEISLGLAAVHAGGIVHRDLKPDNILLIGERVVLTDFGIARSLVSSDVLATSGNIVGTPAYIAPEQLEGGDIDGRADVYALGVLLFELIAKRLPFDGANPTAIACARLVNLPLSLRALVPEVPEGVAQLVMDALARRKEDRPDAHTLVARIARLRGGGGADTRVRLSQTIDLAVPAAQRSVRIAPLDADDATRSLADDLMSALVDALAKERGVRVVRDAIADETIDATLRAVQDRVRIRLRIVDGRGEVVWAGRVEGSLSDPFALEDAVGETVVNALRTRVGGATGPDGAIRERYDQARANMTGGIGNVRNAIVILEALDREAPDNAWVMSMLACAIVGVALQSGADDQAPFARAEELALRALDRDPMNAQGYQAISVIRSVKGEHAGALAAARECLRRSPLLADAHAHIGRVLCWSGRVSEGLQRLELALRLDPANFGPADDKIRTLALMGDRPGAERELARIEQTHPFGGIVVRLRLFAWWGDREVAAQTVDLMIRSQSMASWQGARPVIEAYAQGNIAELIAYGRTELAKLTSARVIPRHRALMHETAAELFALMELHTEVLEQVTNAAALPTFIDLLWLDRCPNLAPIRATAAFAQARAIVAERVAQLLE
ncbi:MAG: protein kinase [Deltaproteobacteria bacterium]|nr:protein kinase [Deltaproteobacteria bacterium]